MLNWILVQIRLLRILQTRPHELGKKKEEGLQDQADSVRINFLEKAANIKEKAAAAEKEQYEKEATPF